MSRLRRKNGDGERDARAPFGAGCAYPGCEAVGVYPAPRTRADLRDYVALCAVHIRDYNSTWDFFAGMSAAEIDAFRREDVTGHRPTWPLGAGARRRDSFIDDDPLGLAEEIGEAAAPPRRRIEREEREALAVLDLAPDVGIDAIKARYKTLVKRFHPDANGGDKAHEERFKLINRAYSYLVSCRGPLTGRTTAQAGAST